MADALASGASGGVPHGGSNPLGRTIKEYMRLWRNWQTRYFEGVVINGRMGSSPINRTINLKNELIPI